MLHVREKSNVLKEKEERLMRPVRANPISVSGSEEKIQHLLSSTNLRRDTSNPLPSFNLLFCVEHGVIHGVIHVSSSAVWRSVGGGKRVTRRSSSLPNTGVQMNPQFSSNPCRLFCQTFIPLIQVFFGSNLIGITVS